MILVTGAAGKTGQAVVRAIAAKGAETRGLVRHAEQSAPLLAAGASETLVADLADGQGLRAALKSVDAIYFICPNVHPDEFKIGSQLINLAKDAGVQRFVYHSVLFPQIEVMPHHWQKLRVEEALIMSGLDFTILQPASYMQNILAFWENMQTTGEFKIPYSPESVFSPVDLEDVAEAAAKVLLEADHSGAIYQLVGPELLSSAAMADLITASLGRKMVCKPQPIAEWQTANKNLPKYSRDALAKMFEYYDTHDFFSQIPDLEKLLGRPPRRFAEFLASLQK